MAEVTQGACMCEEVRPLEGYVWLRLLKGHVCVRR